MKLATLCIHSKAYQAKRNAQLVSLKRHLPKWDHIVLNVTSPDVIATMRPEAVLQLFARGYDGVLFLGADVMFYDSPTFLEGLAPHHSAVVTPHILTPVPNDGLHPSMQDFLKSGQFNADFVYWRNCPQTVAFLQWQEAQHKVRCDASTFWDQGWLNFVSSFLSGTHVLRHPGYNTAYYNLHERPITYRNDRWYVGDSAELVAYHFTGWRDAHTISVHQNRQAFTPDLQRLYAEYAEALCK